MYDQHIDENNPMFDLNRDLMKEQENITIITQDNISEVVTKILLKKPVINNTTTIQKNLFD
jgi:DNA processing protein